MKGTRKLIVLIALILSACTGGSLEPPTATSPPATPLNTSTLARSAESQSPSPTVTSTTTLTPSVTPTSTPRPQPPGAFTLGIEFEGIRNPGDVPGQETTIAAGPEVLVMAMDIAAGIMSKDGRILDVRSMDNFFQPLSQRGLLSIGTNPYILYDQDSERFFVVVAAFEDCYELDCRGIIGIAVSKTSSPLTLDSKSWHFHSFYRSEWMGVPAGAFSRTGDYDTVATSKDNLVLTWDDWDPQSRTPLRAIEKWPLVDGTTPESWTDIIMPSGNVHMATNPDSGRRLFAVGEPKPRWLWSLVEPIADPGLQRSLGINVQPAVTNAEQAVDESPRIFVPGAQARPFYRNGSVWLAKVTDRNYGSGPVTAILWYQVDVTNWPDIRILQNGELGEDGVWHFLPAIAVDEHDNLMLFYARSSEDEFASLRYTGRLASDPPGTLRPSAILCQSMHPVSRDWNGRNTLADYMGIALDPVDDSVWMMGLYPQVGNQMGAWVGNSTWDVENNPQSPNPEETACSMDNTSLQQDSRRATPTQEIREFAVVFVERVAKTGGGETIYRFEVQGATITDYHPEDWGLESSCPVLGWGASEPDAFTIGIASLLPSTTCTLSLSLPSGQIASTTFEHTR